MTTYVGQSNKDDKSIKIFFVFLSPSSDLILLSVQVSLLKGFLEVELITLWTLTPSSRKLATKKTIFFFFKTEKIKRLLLEFN